MKQITFILLVLITLYSCNKENDDVPNYQPGRLTEVSHEAYELGLVYHRYEYTGEDITDLYYYSSPKIYISKFHIKDKNLKEIHFSFENTSKEYNLTDSIRYFYSDSIVVEKYYDYGEGHTEYYVLENGKIISSSWNFPDKFMEFYYEWHGDNLHRIINEFWYGTPLTANTIEYVFQYSDIENPFYFSNIPRIIKEFNNPNKTFKQLTELIPKCSRNFPLKLTIIYDGPLWDGPTVYQEYLFECKIFTNANKPYEVKMITTYDGAHETDRQVDYFLTYEEL